MVNVVAKNSLSKMTSRNETKRKRAVGFRLLIITLKQVQLSAWTTLIIAMLGVLNYEGRFVPLTVNTKFTRAGNALLEQILITYITGMFFYFLIEMVPQTKKKMAVYTSVVNAAHVIRERVDYLVNEIGKTSSNKEQVFDLNPELFSKCSGQIDADFQIVKVWFYPDLTFREFVMTSCGDIKSACEAILSFSDIFDEKWAYSLTKINSLCSTITSRFGIRFEKPKIEAYFILGLYTERLELDRLIKKYDKDFFRLHNLTSKLFFASDLKLPISRKK